MHAILKVIANLINKHFMAINMYTLMFLLISYVALSWLGLTLANEPHLTDNIHSGLDDFTLESVYSPFKKQYEATIIAIQQKEQGCKVNPSLETQLASGDVIYYIADERIVDLNWQKTILN